MESDSASGFGATGSDGSESDRRMGVLSLDSMPELADLPMAPADLLNAGAPSMHELPTSLGPRSTSSQPGDIPSKRVEYQDDVRWGCSDREPIGQLERWLLVQRLLLWQLPQESSRHLSIPLHGTR